MNTRVWIGLSLGLLLAACTPPAPPPSNVSVAISPSTAQSLSVGQTLQLSAQVSGTTNQAVTWSSSAPAIASVSLSGLVQARAVGTATITATSQANTLRSASLTITVQSTGGGGTTGTISGTVSISTLAAAAAPFVDGEVIVKFKPGLSVQTVGKLNAAGVEHQVARGLGERTFLLRSNGKSDKVRTRAAVQELSQRSDVEFAQPNYLLQSFATPNDQASQQNWSFSAIRLNQAWDIERGEGGSPVKIAIIDSGVQTDHPDLQANLLPGYDFISSQTGGRDADPNDNQPGSDFHGTHVAGIAGAVTNNATGVAGVAWGAARLLPLRALSATEGTTADVIDALRWSAGLSVTGVPAIPAASVADIVNMSLGGQVRCSQTPAMQSAIDEVLRAGKIIVVAAGNSNVDASLFSPAGCSGVITVGATNQAGTRASYSNFGPRIDIMAPGGEPAGTQIHSTLGGRSYGGKSGTSMAAPHVSGLLALMKFKKRSLTAEEALSILRRTAVGVDCAGRTNGCGSGLINAEAALNALNAPPPAALILGATPSALSLVAGTTGSVSISIGRVNFSGDVNFALSTTPTLSGVTITPNPTSANTATLNLAPPSNTAAGTYTITVTANASGGVSAQTKVTLTVTSPSAPATLTVRGTLITLFGISASDPTSIECAEELTINQDGVSAPFEFTNLPTSRVYRLQGWKDNNEPTPNGSTDTGDLFAWYLSGGGVANLRPTQTGLQLRLEPYIETQTKLRPAGIFPSCR